MEKEPECPRCGYVSTDDPLQRRPVLVVQHPGTGAEVVTCSHCHAPGERVLRVL